jgi:hypothetical protein
VKSGWVGGREIRVAGILYIEATIETFMYHRTNTRRSKWWCFCAIAVLILWQLLFWFIQWWIYRYRSEDDDRNNNNNTSYHPKQRIVLLGERHSGTTFFTKHLIDCFAHSSSPNNNNITIHVGNVLTANKHWMQRNESYIRSVWEQYGNTDSMPIWPTSHGGQYVPSWTEIATNPSRNYGLFQNTLVIAMTRNPYDWVEAMRKIPHHWPNHVDVASCHYSQTKVRPLPWKQFIQKPLILINRQETNTTATTSPPTLCQKGYLPNTISPCIRTEQYPLPIQCNNNNSPTQPAFITTFASVNDPVYELKDSGMPYANLLELRTAKLLNLLSVPHMWKLYGFVHVQYEDLVRHGTRSIIQNISHMMMMMNVPPPRCEFLPPMKKKKQSSRSKYKMETAWKQWIDQHVDWDVEAQVGYYKQNDSF